jgi:ribonuclease P/MRP protein subunit RPP1
MISTNNVEQAKKLIKSESKPIIIRAQDDVFNRKILEYGKFDILLSPETGIRRESLRQSDSGLNEIVARIAAKNKVAIGIDLEDIRRLPKEEKAKRLIKIRQNLEICRKTKTQIKVLSNQPKQLVSSFITSLGGSSQQAKSSISI